MRWEFFLFIFLLFLSFITTLSLNVFEEIQYLNQRHHKDGHICCHGNLQVMGPLFTPTALPSQHIDQQEEIVFCFSNVGIHTRSVIMTLKETVS